FSQRCAPCGGALHSCQSVPSHVRGYNRRFEGFYPTVENQPAALSSYGEERSAPGIQVRAVHRGAVVRTFPQAESVNRRRDHMSSRFITMVTRAGVLAGVLTVASLPVTVTGQVGAAGTPKPVATPGPASAAAAQKPAPKAAAKTWTLARTPWGDPD